MPGPSLSGERVDEHRGALSRRSRRMHERHNPLCEISRGGAAARMRRCEQRDSPVGLRRNRQRCVSFHLVATGLGGSFNDPASVLAATPSRGSAGLLLRGGIKTGCL